MILCGARYGPINTNYLEICRGTGGTLHLIEEEITDLMAKTEGEVIKIGSQKWKVEGGMFQLIR